MFRLNQKGQAITEYAAILFLIIITGLALIASAGLMVMAIVAVVIIILAFVIFGRRRS